MKVDIKINELIDFLTGAGNADEIKQTVAGAFLALANDPAVIEAAQKRFDRMAEEAMKRVIDTAIVAQRTTYPSHRQPIGGWAFDMLKAYVGEQLKDASVTYTINEQVSEHMQQYKLDRDKAIEEISVKIERTLTQMIPTMVTDQYAERVATVYDTKNLRKIVREEVIEYMRSAFKG